VAAISALDLLDGVSVSRGLQRCSQKFKTKSTPHVGRVATPKPSVINWPLGAVVTAQEEAGFQCVNTVNERGTREFSTRELLKRKLSLRNLHLKSLCCTPAARSSSTRMLRLVEVTTCGEDGVLRDRVGWRMSAIRARDRVGQEEEFEVWVDKNLHSMNLWTKTCDSKWSYKLHFSICWKCPKNSLETVVVSFSVEFVPCSRWDSTEIENRNNPRSGRKFTFCLLFFQIPPGKKHLPYNYFYNSQLKVAYRWKTSQESKRRKVRLNLKEENEYFGWTLCSLGLSRPELWCWCLYHVIVIMGISRWFVICSFESGIVRDYPNVLGTSTHHKSTQIGEKTGFFSYSH